MLARSSNEASSRIMDMDLVTDTGSQDEYLRKKAKLRRDIGKHDPAILSLRTDEPRRYRDPA